MALLQVAILLFWVAIILARAGIAFPRWSHSSRWLAWVAVAFAAIGLLLNLITPSAGERIIWAPVALILLGCSLLVASSPADQIR
ncbi:MAG: hypothetical protein HGB22_00780 [Chlorobiaceae bacterium]|nr:hypothetical protein [Chlorobiaceae bacterium]